MYSIFLHMLSWKHTYMYARNEFLKLKAHMMPISLNKVEENLKKNFEKVSFLGKLIISKERILIKREINKMFAGYPCYISRISLDILLAFLFYYSNILEMSLESSITLSFCFQFINIILIESLVLEIY